MCVCVVMMRSVDVSARGLRSLVVASPAGRRRLERCRAPVCESVECAGRRRLRQRRGAVAHLRPPRTAGPCHAPRLRRLRRRRRRRRRRSTLVVVAERHRQHGPGRRRLFVELVGTDCLRASRRRYRSRRQRDGLRRRDVTARCPLQGRLRDSRSRGRDTHAADWSAAGRC